MNPRIIIVVAIAAIGIGVYGLLGQSGSTVTQHPVVNPVMEEKIKVYLADKEFMKGEQIDRSKVKIDWLTRNQANLKGIDKNMVLPFDSILLARKVIPSGAIIYPEFTVVPDDNDYVDFVIQPGFIPFPLEVQPGAIVGGVIHNDSVVDVLALTTKGQNLAIVNEISSNSYMGISLTPILMGIKVIKVEEVSEVSTNPNRTPQKHINLILELSPKQVATITVARKIAQLEIHKSVGELGKHELSADAGDVLDDYKSIKEFRADDAKIN